MLLNFINGCQVIIKKNMKYLKASSLKGTRFANILGLMKETFKNIKKNIKVNY